MKVLAIDTAAGACSAAVGDGAMMHERLRAMDRGHAEALLPLLLQAMDDAGCGFVDLDLVAVTIGPGAFTGLRIGLATARGIAVAARLSCVGVTTLEAVAEAAGPAALSDRPLLVALDTRRGEVYAQVFVAGEPIGAPEIALPEDLARRYAGRTLTVAGDATAAMLAALWAEGAVAERAAGVPEYPTAGRVAAIAARRWLAGIRPATPPLPLYLRAPAIGPQPRTGAGR